MPPPVPANEPSQSAATLPAAQGPPAADRSPSGSPTRRWYGWQPLVIDGALLVGLVAVASNQRHSDSDNFLIPFTTAYILGGPIVHAAHGHVGKAVLSLGIRSIGPIFIALGTTNNSSGNESAIGLAVLGVLAIPTAIAVDAAAIAREDVNGEDASLLHRMAAAPWFDPKRGAAGLAASLAF